MESFKENFKTCKLYVSMCDMISYDVIALTCCSFCSLFVFISCHRRTRSTFAYIYIYRWAIAQDAVIYFVYVFNRVYYEFEWCRDCKSDKYSCIYTFGALMYLMNCLCLWNCDQWCMIENKEVGRFTEIVEVLFSWQVKFWFIKNAPVMLLKFL